MYKRQSEEVAAKVKEMNAGVGTGKLTSAECATIPEGESYLAAANSGVVILSANVSEEDAYAYTKAAIENLDELKNISTYFDKFEDVAVSVCVETIPFHPGAARALKEAGMWEDRFTVYGE